MEPESGERREPGRDGGRASRQSGRVERPEQLQTYAGMSRVMGTADGEERKPGPGSFSSEYQGEGVGEDPGDLGTVSIDVREGVRRSVWERRWEKGQRATGESGFNMYMYVYVYMSVCLYMYVCV